MGVTGLWRLIDGVGKQVSLESLEGKVLAVDASILLHQAIKGMKDGPNTHLHVLFLRLCKLLTYKIKPIFIFDGSAPILKRQTVAARQKRREQAEEEAHSVAARLKRKAVQRLAVDNTLGRASAAKQPKPSESDMFELPPLPEEATNDVSDDYYELPIHSMLYSGDIDVNQVDINSEGFKSLPLEYQHEILEELKEHTKHNQTSLSAANIEEADDFSSFQVAKLVKSHKLTNKIEGLRKEMLTELNDHASDPNTSVLQANRVMSEDSTHYLLIKSTPAVSASQSTASTASSQGHPSPNVLPADQQRSLRPERIDHTSVHDSLSSDEEADLMLADSQKMLLDSISNEKRNASTARFGDNDTKSPRHRPRDRIISISSDSEEENVVTAISSTTASGLGILSSAAITEPLNSQPLDTETTNALTTLRSVESTSQLLKTLRAAASEHAADETKVEQTARSLTELSGATVTRAFTIPGSPHETTRISDTARDESTSGVVASKPVISMAAGSTLSTAVVAAVTEIMHSDDSDSDEELIGKTSSVSVAPVSLPHPSVAGLADEILHTPNQDLDAVSRNLQNSQYYLNMDLDKQQAVSQAVTQPMIDDSVELLRLFGVPYVMSPSEAEAQCAKLEQLGLCDGIITDDSDVWLFGGGLVLKNFFQQNRHVTSFLATDILREFGLDREKLIALALVSGSDYTDGIPGAGPVTAIEILSEFGKHCSGIAALKDFKAWVDVVKANEGAMPVSSSNSTVRSKLCKHFSVLPSTFPNHVVVDAYLKPRVDDSSESFAWGRPDLDLLRKFAHRTLNWTVDKVDSLVQPVLKKLNSGTKQPKLESFFNIHSTSINTSADFQSKRLKSAISKLVDTSATLPAEPGSRANSESISERAAPTKSQKTKAGVVRNRKPAKAIQKSKHRQPPSVNIRLVKDEVQLSSEDSDDSG